ncbi:MAG: YitT family protein [Bacteroidaceae bacterium]|nr:YitT family protein [Bacteroidaceae bacterium]
MKPLSYIWGNIKKIDPRTAWNAFVDYFVITLGLAAYAFAYTAFMLPYKIVTGGVTGMATIVYYSMGISVELTYAVINIALLGIALWILGWRFLLKTIYAIFMLTLLLHYAGIILTDPATGELMKILGENGQFMGLILGCLTAGMSLGFIFLHGGSTGGTDIVAAVVNKFKNISMGQGILLADFFIVSSTLFLPVFGENILPDRVSILVYGLCAMFIETTSIDWLMNQRRSSVQFLIFSDKYQEIANAIGTKMNHGVTILDAHGWYTGQKRRVLCILARKNESAEIFQIIKTIDPNAFVSQSRVIGVYGEGFDTIKH